jgi:TolB-like protein
MSIVAELKRRNVFRVGAAYVVFSWLTLQIGDVVFPALHLPEWTLTLVTVLIAIGFLPALIFSWVYVLTPEGVKKESEVDRTSSVTGDTGKKLDTITLIALVAVVAFVLVERGTRAPEPAVPQTTPVEAHEPAPVGATSSGIDQTPESTGDKGLSIAVLPFVNMSADAENEYFSDGVSEELLNVLSRIPELKVAARTSAFQFKGQNRDVAEIGRILKVSNILEGSVRKSGNRVRITAQLIKVDDGFHLWSDTYAG